MKLKKIKIEFLNGEIKKKIYVQLKKNKKKNELTCQARDTSHE
jgi:hypothetical protein